MRLIPTVKHLYITSFLSWHNYCQWRLSELQHTNNFKMEILNFPRRPGLLIGRGHVSYIAAVADLNSYNMRYAGVTDYHLYNYYIAN